MSWDNWTFDWPEDGVQGRYVGSGNDWYIIDEPEREELYATSVYIGCYAPAMDRCPECKNWKLLGGACKLCPPFGMVNCPFSAPKPKHDPKCLACKGSGFVEELK